MQPIVERLASMIEKNSRQDTFQLAIQNARASNPPGIQHIQNMDRSAHDEGPCPFIRAPDRQTNEIPNIQSVFSITPID